MIVNGPFIYQLFCILSCCFYTKRFESVDNLILLHSYRTVLFVLIDLINAALHIVLRSSIIFLVQDSRRLTKCSYLLAVPLVVSYLSKQHIKGVFFTDECIDVSYANATKFKFCSHTSGFLSA